MNTIAVNNQRISNLTSVMLNAKPEICFERAVLLTESYQETEGVPTMVRRAKALENVLKKMTTYIIDGELIVGNLASKPLYAPFFPEYGWEKTLDTLINQRLDAYQTRGSSLFDELENNITDVLTYWEGKTVNDEAERLYSEAAIKAQRGYVLNYHGAMNGLGHITVDYAKVLQKGLSGIRNEAHAELERLKNPNNPGVLNRQFLDAVIISLDAGIRFSKRLARQALDLAKIEKNMRRKKELLQISENCNRVPALVILDSTSGTAVSKTFFSLA